MADEGNEGNLLKQAVASRQNVLARDDAAAAHETSFHVEHRRHPRILVWGCGDAVNDAPEFIDVRFTATCKSCQINLKIQLELLFSTENNGSVWI